MDRVCVRGLWVTAVPLTVLDATLELGEPGAQLLVDLAFPEHQVAVEVDGWAWHHDAATFRADRKRQNAVVLAGWTVLRFTWHDLTQRPAEVVADIRAALDHR